MAIANSAAMIRKNFAIVSLAASLLSPLVSPQDSGPESHSSRNLAGEKQNAGIAPDIQRILKKGKLRVGIHHSDLAPFFMSGKKGELIGHEIEFAQAIAKRLGVEIEFDRSASSYDEIAQKVALREVDLGIAALSRTLDRGKYVKFTDGYFNFTHTLAVNRLLMEKLLRSKPSLRNADIESKLNRKDVIVGIERGTSYIDLVHAKFPEVGIKYYESLTELLEALEKGEVHFTIRVKQAIVQYLRLNPAASLALAVSYMSHWVQQPAGIAVHAQDDHLREWLNLYIAMAKETGFLESLHKSYMEGDDWVHQVKRDQQ